MDTLKIEILNPKAIKLLKNLADMDLIAIRDSSNDDFIKAINKIRTKAKKNPPSLEAITKEVEIVREKRYAKSRR